MGEFPAQRAAPPAVQYGSRSPVRLPARGLRANRDDLYRQTRNRVSSRAQFTPAPFQALGLMTLGACIRINFTVRGHGAGSRVKTPFPGGLSNSREHVQVFEVAVVGELWSVANNQPGQSAIEPGFDPLPNPRDRPHQPSFVDI